MVSGPGGFDARHGEGAVADDHDGTAERVGFAGAESGRDGVAHSGVVGAGECPLRNGELDGGEKGIAGVDDEAVAGVHFGGDGRDEAFDVDGGVWGWGELGLDVRERERGILAWGKCGDEGGQKGGEGDIEVSAEADGDRGV